MLPILNPAEVAKRIIQAVLTDQVFLLLPRSIYVIAALKKLVRLTYSSQNYTEVAYTFFAHTTHCHTKLGCILK